MVLHRSAVRSSAFRTAKRTQISLCPHLELPGRFELPGADSARPFAHHRAQNLWFCTGRQFGPPPSTQQKGHRSLCVLIWSCPADSNCRARAPPGPLPIIERKTYGFAQVGSSILCLPHSKKDTGFSVSSFGAVEQIRTADLVITNDVLCLLSYNSIWRP